MSLVKTSFNIKRNSHSFVYAYIYSQKVNFLLFLHLKINVVWNCFCCCLIFLTSFENSHNFFTSDHQSNEERRSTKKGELTNVSCVVSHAVKKIIHCLTIDIYPHTQTTTPPNIYIYIYNKIREKMLKVTGKWWKNTRKRQKKL